MADQQAGAIPDDDSAAEAPAWVMPTIRRAMWTAVFVVLAVLSLLWALDQARDLVVIIVVATFLSLAIIPAVDALVRKRGWSRGISTLLVMITVFVGVVALIVFLVPALVDVAGKLTKEVPQWLQDARDSGLPVPGLNKSDAELMAQAEAWLKKNAGSHVLSVAGSGAGLIAKLFLTFIFTIIITSSEPQILRAVLSRLRPAHQERLIDAWHTAISQTGGYFYSRLLLMVFTSTGYFIVMVLLGMPVLFAIPCALFGAFFVEFIPLVGGYVGMALPALMMLVEKGWVRALVVLAWAVVYQQIHDYVLSPRISSRTMTLSPGIALTSALVGGSIAGPLGALFAMPTAGMVTAFLGKYLPSQPIVVTGAALGEPEAAKHGSKHHERHHQNHHDQPADTHPGTAPGTPPDPPAAQPTDR